MKRVDRLLDRLGLVRVSRHARMLREQMDATEDARSYARAQERRATAADRRAFAERERARGLLARAERSGTLWGAISRPGRGPSVRLTVDLDRRLVAALGPDHDLASPELERIVRKLLARAAEVDRERGGSAVILAETDPPDPSARPA